MRLCDPSGRRSRLTYPSLSVERTPGQQVAAAIRRIEDVEQKDRSAFDAAGNQAAIAVPQQDGTIWVD